MLIKAYGSVEFKRSKIVISFEFTTINAIAIQFGKNTCWIGNQLIKPKKKKLINRYQPTINRRLYVYKFVISCFAISILLQWQFQLNETSTCNFKKIVYYYTYVLLSVMLWWPWRNDFIDNFVTNILNAETYYVFIGILSWNYSIIYYANLLLVIHINMIRNKYEINNPTTNY